MKMKGFISKFFFFFSFISYNFHYFSTREKADFGFAGAYVPNPSERPLEELDDSDDENEVFFPFFFHNKKLIHFFFLFSFFLNLAF